MRSLQVTGDYPFETTTEKILLQCLRQNQTNRTAFEYLMAYYLLTMNLDSFVNYFPGAGTSTIRNCRRTTKRHWCWRRSSRAPRWPSRTATGNSPGRKRSSVSNGLTSRWPARQRSPARQNRTGCRVWQHLLVLLHFWGQRRRRDPHRPVLEKTMNARHRPFRAVSPLLLLLIQMVIRPLWLSGRQPRLAERRKPASQELIPITVAW